MAYIKGLARDMFSSAIRFERQNLHCDHSGILISQIRREVRQSLGTVGYSTGPLKTDVQNTLELDASLDLGD